MSIACYTCTGMPLTREVESLDEQDMNRHRSVKRLIREGNVIKKNNGIPYDRAIDIAARNQGWRSYHDARITLLGAKP